MLRLNADRKHWRDETLPLRIAHSGGPMGIERREIQIGTHLIEPPAR
jgi:hypothetical protein